jgi:DNA-binding MarR family transcriptional regulator
VGRHAGRRPGPLTGPTVSPADRRRVDVSLAPYGRQRFDQVWPGHANSIRRYVVQPLTPPDITELGRILASLIQANQDQPG